MTIRNCSATLQAAWLACVVFVALPGTARAVLLFQDDFNDLDGNVTTTDKIQGATGTLVGGVTRSSADVAPPNSGGFAADFSTNNANDAVNYGNITALHNKSALTITMWIKPTTVRTNGSRLISKANTGGNQQIWEFDVRDQSGNNNLRAVIPTSGGAGGVTPIIDTSGVGPIGTIALNTWQFVAFTWEDATDDGKWYKGTLGGGLLGPETLNPFDGKILSTSAPLLLGNIGAVRNFHGLFDNVRIYDNALSFSELDAVMRFDDVASLIPEPSGLILSALGLLSLSLAAWRKQRRL